MRPSFVYFVEHGNLIKIGVSTNVAARLKALPGTLLALQDGDRYTEKCLHQRFAALRVYGEWFRCDPELCDYIGRLPADPQGLTLVGKGPNAEASVAKVVAAHAEMRHQEAIRKAAAHDRALAIEEALECGATLKVVGETLGVSAQRVQQMRAAK